MSRIGKKSIFLSTGVVVVLEGSTLRVSGPCGVLCFVIPPSVRVACFPDRLEVSTTVSSRFSSSAHGLVRAILSNMVAGVIVPFKKELEIHGVGYKAELRDGTLVLNVGYSHPVVYSLPETVKVEIDKQVKVLLSCPDKQLLGRVASEIRSIKPPDPYKAKGIKFSGEFLRRKAGKSAAGGKGR